MRVLHRDIATGLCVGFDRLNGGGIKSFRRGGRLRRHSESGEKKSRYRDFSGCHATGIFARFPADESLIRRRIIASQQQDRVAYNYNVAIRALQFYGDGTLSRVPESLRRDLTRYPCGREAA
jgi:hypothetical protein